VKAAFVRELLVLSAGSLPPIYILQGTVPQTFVNEHRTVPMAVQRTTWRQAMQDLIHVAAMVLFFPVAFLFMGFLDRLLGPDQGKGPLYRVKVLGESGPQIGVDLRGAR
jgi:hypothetical protein